MDIAKCRSCHAPLTVTFADLGMSPLSNSFVTADRAVSAETFLPLHAYVCSECWLVQVLDFESPAAIFKDYAYLSSYSDMWLRHCERYCGDMVARFGLNRRSLVLEIASNDGSLLKTFMARTINLCSALSLRTTSLRSRDETVFQQRQLSSEPTPPGR
ncbi:hypothetical protein ACVWW4_008008 [Bradyrhizobium sp. LB7.1]